MGEKPQKNASPSNKNGDELQCLNQRPPICPNMAQSKKRFSRQLSLCETPRNIAWEKRQQHQRKKNGVNLTDEDMNELKGCIELGFGFNQEDGKRLCTTIPALDLFLAVNRQVYSSPISSPTGGGSAPSLGATIAASSIAAGRSSAFGGDSDTWKICSPGDNPQDVKTKLRHWAQAVACSLRQSS